MSPPGGGDAAQPDPGSRKLETGKAKRITEFDPDWCIRPGVSLREWREEKGLNLGAAALACRIGMGLYIKLEYGQVEIDAVIAAALSFGTGTSPEFWLARERHYRDALAAGKKDVSDV